jgi:hypothetical protein
LIGATAAGSIAVVAFRWSRRDAAAGALQTATADADDDPALRERLDDELRDLD